MADPKVPEPELTAQGQIYGRASKTDEKIPELEPEYRGSGATPQQKEEEKKSWISEGHTDAHVDDQIRDDPRPAYDTYAQELDKRLGPIATVKDKIADTVVTAKEKLSATSNSASDTKNSATGTFSQYTQAAWEKMNDLMPTVGANQSSLMGDKESTLNQRMAGISEMGHQNASSVVENMQIKTPNIGHKILGAGGDDVFKIMADGGSTHDDRLKANMRATAETLI